MGNYYPEKALMLVHGERGAVQKTSSAGKPKGRKPKEQR